MKHLVSLLDLDDASPSPVEVAADPVDVGTLVCVDMGSLVVVVVAAAVVGGAAVVLAEGTAAGVTELIAGVGVVHLIYHAHLTELGRHCVSFFGHNCGSYSHFLMETESV